MVCRSERCGEGVYSLFDDADAFRVEGDQALAEEEAGGLFEGAFGGVEFLADEGWGAFV